MDRAWLGIDPGVSGAVACITDGLALVEDWPGDAALTVDLLRGWLCEYSVRLCALEAATSRPAQGVRSVFTFGRNFGQWEGLLSALGVPFQIVTPGNWQRGLVRPSDGASPKERALTVARRLYPDMDLHRKGDDGKADALLLATFAKRIEDGGRGS